MCCSSSDDEDAISFCGAVESEASREVPLGKMSAESAERESRRPPRH